MLRLESRIKSFLDSFYIREGIFDEFLDLKEDLNSYKDFKAFFYEFFTIEGNLLKKWETKDKDLLKTILKVWNKGSISKEALVSILKTNSLTKFLVDEYLKGLESKKIVERFYLESLIKFISTISFYFKEENLKEIFFLFKKDFKKSINRYKIDLLSLEEEAISFDSFINLKPFLDIFSKSSYFKFLKYVAKRSDFDDLSILSQVLKYKNLNEDFYNLTKIYEKEILGNKRFKKFFKSFKGYIGLKDIGIEVEPKEDFEDFYNDVKKALYKVKSDFDLAPLLKYRFKKEVDFPKAIYKIKGYEVFIGDTWEEQLKGLAEIKSCLSYGEKDFENSILNRNVCIVLIKRKGRILGRFRIYKEKDYIGKISKVYSKESLSLDSEDLENILKLYAKQNNLFYGRAKKEWLDKNLEMDVL